MKRLILIALLLSACGGGDASGGYDVTCYDKMGNVVIDGHYEHAYVTSGGTTVMYDGTVVGSMYENYRTTTLDCVVDAITE